ncbi:MAG: hypothetical protein ACAI43_11455 [Phycisphaerae bacterium]|nr:hypothetical protein [Tepidisphaeraceae bacterium]
MRFTFFLVLGMFPFVAAVAADAPPPNPAALIRDLTSEDADARAAASERLAALGPAARPALVDAVNGQDLTLRQSAGAVLLRLPFDRPDDPEAVRGVLKTYGHPDPATRKSLVTRVVADAGKDAAPAILRRLIREEPTDDVRWTMLGALRQAVMTGAIPVDAVDAKTQRAPNVALAGLAWQRKAPAAAATFFEKALELEAKSPTKEIEVVLVFYDLAGAYVRLGRFDDAADAHRRGYARNPLATITRGSDGEKTDHGQLLFLLHAKYGPLKGFADDLEAQKNRLAYPHFQYTVGRAYERAGHALVAEALYRAAYLCTADTPKARADAGETAYRLGLVGPAEQQYSAAIAAGSNAAGLGEPLETIEARLQVSLILGRRGDDFAAAEQMRRVVEGGLPAGARLTGVVGGTRRLTAADAAKALEVNMHWRYLRHATARANANSIKAHAREIARLNPDAYDVAIDAVPALRDLGWADKADALFETAYARAAEERKARPDDAAAQNRVAWLCARGARRLDEARGLIEAALKAEADNPAYLDTAAEIAFAQGRPADAVTLQSRAVSLRPGDRQLREGLERYKKGK